VSTSTVFGRPGSSVVSEGRWVTVPEWQRAVVFADGALTGTEGAGRHRRKRRSVWNLVDIRPSVLTIPTQEVLTLDGVQVRLSVVATVTVTDAAAWVTGSVAPFEVIYSTLQVALRDRVAGTELANISASRSTLLEGVEDELRASFVPVGATVTGIALKDITLPVDVRVALSQAALAKQRGLAELERARAEAASLRSLANTAKLIEENPVLLDLRTLQAAAEGATVIIHRGSGDESAK
jgi:regulator of protease activity HflC (stomatin/prohibitin superfamily)